MIEYAVTQSKKHLDAACSWWLSKSEGKHNNVLWINVNSKKRKIHIEVWKRGHGKHRYVLRGYQEEEGGPMVDYKFDNIGEDSGDTESELHLQKIMLRNLVNDDDDDNKKARLDEAGEEGQEAEEASTGDDRGGANGGGRLKHCWGGGRIRRGGEREEQEEEEEREEEEEEESEEAAHLGIARPQIPLPTPSIEGEPPTPSSRKGKTTVREEKLVVTAPQLKLYAQAVLSVPPSGKLSAPML